MTNFNELKYYKWNSKQDTVLHALKDSDYPALPVFNNDETPVCYLAFNDEISTGERLPLNDPVVSSHINWWIEHPDTVPDWITEKPEVE